MARHANRLPGSFEERCLVVAEQAEAEAATLPLGPKRDELIQKARQARTTASLNNWLLSPGLKPPS